MVSAQGCRVGFTGEVVGICVPACNRSEDCGAATLQCVLGVCVPREALTPDGPVAMLPVKDGQASFTPQARDAGTRGDAGGVTDAGSLSAAGSSPDAGATTAPDARAATDAAPSNSDGLLTHGTTTEDGTTFPNPKPVCPCSSDFDASTSAPQLGEVPKNAYGGPLPAITPTPLALAQGSLLECAESFALGDPYPQTFKVSNECVRFASCPVSCQEDVDCPAGGSGAAVPRCAGTKMCYLDCRQGRSCPDGMACISGTDGAACYWPQDIYQPGCPGYCNAQPPPRECPNWCAEVLVACDLSKGVKCCQGLTCTAGGYCDRP